MFTVIPKQMRLTVVCIVLLMIFVTADRLAKRYGVGLTRTRRAATLSFKDFGSYAVVFPDSNPDHECAKSKR